MKIKAYKAQDGKRLDKKSRRDQIKIRRFRQTGKKEQWQSLDIAK
jgi:hypothetical protein